MKRSLVIVSAVATATALIVIGASGGSTRGAAGQTFTLIVRGTDEYAAVDNSPNSATKGSNLAAKVSTGDVLAGSRPVYDTTGHHVGTLDYSCIATTRGATIRRAAYSCTAGYKLAAGLIDIAYVVGQSETTSAAVIGGTGKYAGVRGTLRSIERAGPPEGHGLLFSTDTFTLDQ